MDSRLFSPRERHTKWLIVAIVITALAPRLHAGGDQEPNNTDSASGAAQEVVTMADTKNDVELDPISVQTFTTDRFPPPIDALLSDQSFQIADEQDLSKLISLMIHTLECNRQKSCTESPDLDGFVVTQLRNITYYERYNNCFTATVENTNSDRITSRTRCEPTWEKLSDKWPERGQECLRATIAVARDCVTDLDTETAVQVDKVFLFVSQSSSDLRGILTTIWKKTQIDEKLVQLRITFSDKNFYSAGYSKTLIVSRM